MLVDKIYVQPKDDPPGGPPAPAGSPAPVAESDADDTESDADDTESDADDTQQQSSKGIHLFSQTFSNHSNAF